MKIVVEFNRNHNHNDDDFEDDIELTNSVNDNNNQNQCLLPILTCGLAISITVRPISELIKSVPPVVWLQAAVSNTALTSQLQTNTALANRLYAAMQRKGYPVAKGNGETNIIYLRGGDSDGKPTGNRINEWSDTRFVLMFRGGESTPVGGSADLRGVANPKGQPYIAGAWKATVKPGLPAIRNPLGKNGAAFIEDGYYSAWRLGTHRGIFGRVERGLVQVAPVKFRRDVNHNGNVTGEAVQSGMIGLNQHSGSNSKNVDETSYACLVGQSSDGHLNQFIPLLENDPRYKLDSQYMFGTSILSVNDL